MLRFIKKEKRNISLSFLLGIIISVMVGAFCSKAYADKVQRDLAENVIRFHVIANSDSENDVALKLIVRDEVIKLLEEKLDGCHNKNESRKIIEENLGEIEEAAKNVSAKNGFHYDIKAEICEDVFPLRQYGDVRMPAGNYEALKISIGKAQGHNWWCVVYPPLCFADIASGEITAESENRLVAEGSSVLVESHEAVPEFKFKVVEFWKELEHKGDSYAVKP